MATRPTDGGSDGTWGAELNAHLDISLDADGKVDDGAAQTTSAAPGADAELANKKYTDDQDAADHPAYTGGESHTDGSGFIMKMGNIIDSGATTTPVSFAVAFPNAIVSVVVTGIHNANTNEVLINSGSKSVNGFTIRCEIFRATSYDWIAIGY